MALLNRLFGSPASLAKNAEIKDKEIMKTWNDYKSTLPLKKRLLSLLPSSFGQKKTVLPELKKLLDLELIDIHTEEKEETEEIGILRSLEHSNRIRRVHRLKECLCYAETKYHYIYNLLLHLYVTLHHQADLCQKLSVVIDLRKFRKLIAEIQSEFRVEETIINKIDARETFSEILLALVKGEQIIEQISAKEKRLIKSMRGDTPLGGITDRWVVAVLEAIEDKVYEYIAEGILDLHPQVDFEYVNRPEFIILAQEKIELLRGRKVSAQLVQALVHLFREKYNQRD